MTLAKERYRPDPNAPDLGDAFYTIVDPAAFPAHVLRFRNDRWADRIGLASLSDEEWTRHLGRFEPLPGNIERPLALAYHGHQFRSYNPQIGDGRGFLFAQIRDAEDGRLLDLGTKGSGATPYSRGGDGRLTLKGGVREILATEALEARGVYTSKTLSMIETGEALERGDEPSPTRSCVLVRLSHSHIRFGSFQRLAFFEDEENLERLLDHAVALHYPALQDLPRKEKAESFLSAVAERSARLAASWMAAGFVHGVLNTDNCNVTGESFDYGPWRFLPQVDPGFTAAYFDHAGLYAYGRQAEAMLWNLSRLGGTLIPFSDEEALTEALGVFSDAYVEGTADAFFQRLGLQRGEDAADLDFVQSLLTWMQGAGVSFEQTLFDLFCGKESAGRRAASPQAEAYEAPAFEAIRARLDAYAPQGEERLGHPYFARTEPEDVLIDEVEAIWSRIDQDEDWSALSDKVAALRSAGEAYALSPVSAPEGHVAVG